MQEPTWTCVVAAARAAIGIVADRLYSSPVQTALKPATSASAARAATRRNRSGPRPAAAKTVTPYTNAPLLRHRSRSASAEVRGPFFYKGSDAFLGFFAAEQRLHLLSLVGQAVRQGGFVGGVHRADHGLLRGPGGPAQLRSQAEGFRASLSGRNEAADQSHAVRLVGGDLAAGEHDVQGLAPADQPGQPLGPARAGDETQPGLGQPEAG